MLGFWHNNDDGDDGVMMNSSYYYHHCHNHYFYQYLFIITDEGYSDEWVSLRSVQENQVLLQYATILLRSATEYMSFPFGHQNATSSLERFTSKEKQG